MLRISEWLKYTVADNLIFMMHQQSSADLKKKYKSHLDFLLK